MATKPVLSTASAREAVAACEEKARTMGVAVAIAVVDDGGHLLVFVRMDGTHAGAIEIAIAKARSSAMFKRPTARFEEAVAGGAVGLLRLPDVLPFGGGVPFMSDGHLVGAVGVSGSSANDDAMIASAALVLLDPVRAATQS